MFIHFFIQAALSLHGLDSLTGGIGEDRSVFVGILSTVGGVLLKMTKIMTLIRKWVPYLGPALIDENGSYQGFLLHAAFQLLGVKSISGIMEWCKKALAGDFGLVGLMQFFQPMKIINVC